jgi:chromosomal replication initiator protein
MHNPWEEAQVHLQELLDEHSYKNWFSQTRYESFDGGCLVLTVPSHFFADWLRDHYMDAICESVRRVLPAMKEVRFQPAGEELGMTEARDSIRSTPVPVTPPPRRAAKVQTFVKGFNPKYTFGNFVIGGSNRFAHAAARAVADSPGRAYNPLFLYGGTGLGKTHLMQAIGQEVISKRPQANVVFMSSEHFTNELIESIAKKSTQRFRDRYRQVDVLLLDDIHFIAGKEATQEEFFHTFNVLFDRHKQIILSSDRGPKEIQGMEDRLVSRFEWGLVTDIQPPDLETRSAILKSKARQDGISVPEDVIRYIATYVTTSVRELEGALITTLAYGRLTEQKVSTLLVDEVLRDLIGKDKIRPVTIEMVMRIVAQHFDVRIADLRGRSRQRQIAYPRQLAMYLCKDLVPNLSLKDVGEAFGGKDHTTVLYSCDKVSKEMQDNSSVRQTIDILIKKIRSG